MHYDKWKKLDSELYVCIILFHLIDFLEKAKL